MDVVELFILKIFFRQSFLHDGGMFLEVKILKNFDPIWGFHPKFLFGNLHFLVISHIDGVSWSDCLPRGVYIGMYKDLYYKMMTFRNRVWMENDVGGPIFWIFHFQISPPIWDM